MAHPEALEVFDFDSRYRVHGYDGIAWYAARFATEWTEESWEFVGGEDNDTEDESNYLYSEPEQIEDRSRVVCVMVGDDREFTFEIEELTPLAEDAYCHECGQIGCMGDTLVEEWNA